MHPLLEYIEHYDVKHLSEQFHISVKHHPVYPNLVHLKYHQIDTPHNEITNWCRGTIVDINTNKFVSLPYKRFFNYGETEADDILWNTASIFEKLDGSLVVMFNFDNQWHIHTSGTSDANSPMTIGNETFKECFWRIWKQKGYDLPILTNHCYMFELLTPYNRIIVPQTEERIILHGVRNIQTLNEGCPEQVALSNGWECVKSFSFKSLDDVINTCSELDPMKQEGFVVRDIRFNRIKIKSPQYVALHHIKGSFSARRMLEVIMKHEHQEFISYFQEWKPAYEEIKNRIEQLLLKTTELWNQYKDIKDQKEFALAIKDKPQSCLLFSVRCKRFNSVQEAFNNLNIKKAEELIDLNNIELNNLNHIREEKHG